MYNHERSCIHNMRSDLLDLAKDICCIDIQMLERGDRVLRMEMLDWRDKAQEIIKKYGNPGG